MYQQPLDASPITASSKSDVSPLPDASPQQDISLQRQGGSQMSQPETLLKPPLLQQIPSQFGRLSLGRFLSQAAGSGCRLAQWQAQLKQLGGQRWVQLAQAEGQKAGHGIAQQFTIASQKIDWSQPYWTQLAIAGLLLVLPTGVSATAFQVLAQPPQPNCDQSRRFRADLAKLQCLRQAMQSSEHQAILQSLQQLQSWPRDSPVYGLSQRLLEDWSVVALSLARREFEAGQWNQAIQLASAIPARLALGSQAQADLNVWQTVRNQGQIAYDLALGALEQQDWQTARGHAETLAQLSNDYWRQQGLKELPQQIELARQAQQPSIEAESRLAVGSETQPGAREHQLSEHLPRAISGAGRRSRMPVLVSLERLTVAEPKQVRPEFS